MVRCRDAQLSGRGLGGVVNDGVVIPVLQALLNPGVEFDRPVERPRVVGEIDPPQIMDDIAASDDKDAVAAQVLQFFTKREVEFWPLDHVEADLEYRDVRLPGTYDGGSPWSSPRISLSGWMDGSDDALCHAGSVKNLPGSLAVTV